MKLHNLIYEYDRTPMALVEDPHGGSDPESVPGTGEPAALEVTPPAAEPLNTDPGSPPPSSVPYSRFKEVNDARRSMEEAMAPIAELEQLGYPVAELQRLAQWETEFAQDPVEAWVATARSIENLPDGIKAAIEAHSSGAGAATPPAQEPPAGVEPEPPTAEKVPEELQWLIDREKAREKAEAEAAQRAEAEARRQTGAAALDSIVKAWKEQDEKDQVKTPEATMMAHIMAAATQTDSVEETFKIARSEWLASREETLQSTVHRPALGLRTVPGSGSGQTPAQPPRPARTLKEASKIAAAAWGEQPVE
jgi:hypothetical protein